MMTPEQRAVAKAIARNARRVLNEKGVGVSEFAAEHNIPYGTLYTFIHGQQLPSLITAKRIACALEVSLDYLCGLNNMDDEEETDEQDNFDREHLQ